MFLVDRIRQIEVQSPATILNRSPGNRRGNHRTQHLQGTVHAHQPVTALPVELQRDRFADSRYFGTVFEDMQIVAVVAILVGVHDGQRLATTGDTGAGITGLAAAGGIENRLVYHDCVVSRGGDDRLDLLQVAVFAKEFLSHGRIHRWVSVNYSPVPDLARIAVAFSVTHNGLRSVPPATVEAMTSRIVQNHPERGTREFELVGDSIEYRITSPFSDEELSVVLSVLSPEPVVDGPTMYFLSEVNREALIKLFVDLPDAETFAAFVQTVKQRIREEDFGRLSADNRKLAITQEQVDTTIRMLESNIEPGNIDGLLTTLRGLSEAPDNHEQLNRVVEAFDSLGVQQGPVLTYAPFFCTLLSSTDLNDLS